MAAKVAELVVMVTQRHSEHADITRSTFAVEEENGLEMPIFHFEEIGLPSAHVIICRPFEIFFDAVRIGCTATGLHTRVTNPF